MCAHSEQLIKNKDLVSEGKNRNLVLLGWGNDFNRKENVDLCKSLGMDGIIHDRLVQSALVKKGLLETIIHESSLFRVAEFCTEKALARKKSQMVSNS